MNLFLGIVIQTANILGIFSDPFEFEGDYGSEVNPVRQKVFELVVAKEALTKNLTYSHVREILRDSDADDLSIENYKKLLISEAIEKDRQHGPTLSELVPPELVKEICKKQKELQNAGFTDVDLGQILYFLERYGNEKVFRFLRNSPPELLNLDKTLRDKASREGKNFSLPLLSSSETLKGQNSFELKKNLLDAVFTKETLDLTKPEEVLKKMLENLDRNFLKEYFGKEADNQNLEGFSSPAGQTFFYWMYHTLNLHLVSEETDAIEQINKVKQIFAQTIAEPTKRALAFKEKLLASNSEIVFTQESDAFVPQALIEEGLFHSVDKQNPQDGCFIFLRADLWNPHYEIINIENYEGFKAGKINLILAMRKETGEHFLLASAHGHSTKPEDGRLQISLIMEKYHQLSQKPENAGLQLVIGIDANTKTEEDVKALREHLDHLGLNATSVGPTTIKRRMVTVQHAKAGRVAVDEEDYLIILKPENGGRYLLSHPTVGFKSESPDLNQPLPNRENPSDHYPIGATLEPVQSIL